MTSLVPLIKELAKNDSLTFEQLIDKTAQQTGIDINKVKFRIRKCIDKKELFEIEGKMRLNNKNNIGYILNLKGKTAEAFVYELAKNTFLTDWCYLNPKLPNGKEICDLLIVYDDTLIIWQIKDLKLDKDNKYDEWQVKRNLKQILTAKYRLLKSKLPIELENPQRGKEQFDPTKIKKTYLISALLGAGEDYYAFMSEREGNKIHTFTRKFTEIVLKELDTINDFTEYLKAKESILPESRIILNNGEEELLAYYIMNERTFRTIGESPMSLIVDGIWEELQKKPEYIARNEENQISYGGDDIIERAHESNDYKYELIAKELARPNRFQRRILAKTFYDAHVRADKERVNNNFRRIIPTEECTYCFVFLDKSKDRENRKALLQTVCFIARGLYKKVNKVIGIATEMTINPTCSYDYSLLFLPEWTEENQKEMEKIQKETGLFTNTKAMMVHEDEYPNTN